MSISAEVIGGRSTRRKIVCVNCGKHQMPSRRQRASRFRPTCRHCGCSRFDEASEMKLLTKAAKQRRESAEIYQNEGRIDLAQKEIEELNVITRYLPEQLSENELQSEIDQVIEDTGASSPQDMGKVMGVVIKKLAGKADGKQIAELVKKRLSS